MDNKNMPAVIDAEFKSAEPEATMAAPDVVVLDRKPKQGAGKINADIGDVTIGTGDIENDKSAGKNMQVSGGTVNMTINNDNSKTINKNRFAEAANMSVPVAAETGDKSMEM